MAAVFYTINENGKLARTNHPDHAEKVMLDIKEYNGLQNALRIVRERAIQQIDKSQADEHGYKLLRANYKKYDVRNNKKAWLVIKSTPYSNKIPFREAKSLIENDLCEFYNYFQEFMIEAEENKIVKMKTVSTEDILNAASMYGKPGYEKYLLYGNLYGANLKKMFDEFDGAIVFEIACISVNYAAGVYEVSYWATDNI